MDSRGPPMYLHPGMSMMGESHIGSVPGSIPINVPMSIPAPSVTGMQGVPMSGNHVTFSHKANPNKMPEHQHYNQLPVRKEVYDEERIGKVYDEERIGKVYDEERIGSAVLPETAAPQPTEEDSAELGEGSQQMVKTEAEEDIDNFMEAAHDVFLKITSKEITIKTASEKLGRPYSFVYSRYQEFVGDVAEKDELPEKKKKTKKGKKTRRRKRLTMVKSRPKLTGEIYQCEECPAIFYREAQLKTHRKVHLEDHESHKCTACGVVFSRLNKLMAHRVEFHQEALQCPHCDSRYTNVPSYNYHILTHTGGKPYKCSECGKGFTKKYSLQNHKRTHTGERPYMCGFCGKTFTTLNGVKLHRYIHTGGQDKPYECELCGQRYQFNSALAEHMNTHTGAKPYACDLCDARFNFKQNLMRHSMTHTGETPHKCDLCPAIFYLPTDLKRHKISHTGLKPFKCELCDYACTRKSNLEFHKYVHTGETPYKCDFYGCNAEFSRPKNLKKHKLQHGPPPPQTCKVCHEKFPDLISLKRHMMSHTGEKPHTCDQCFKTCIDAGALKRHMYKHMYRPLAQKTKQVRQTKKNPGVKKPSTAPMVHKKWPTEYQGVSAAAVAAENGHSSQGLPTATATAAAVGHHAWNINAEYTNLVNNAAWPSTMDPDEFRRRLLHSFK